MAPYTPPPPPSPPWVARPRARLPVRRFIIAFASAEYMAFGPQNESARSVLHAFVNTFYKSMGDVDPGEEEYMNAYSDPFDYPTVLLIVFLLIIVLLLQNFLIAFMGDAYEDTKDKAKAMWCLEPDPSGKSKKYHNLNCPLAESRPKS